MGLFGIVKNLVLLSKNAPKIPGIITQLASPNFIDNVAGIMVKQELGEEIEKIKQAEVEAMEDANQQLRDGEISEEDYNDLVQDIEESKFNEQEFIETATKEKIKQIKPPVSAALTPVTAAFGVPVFLQYVAEFMSNGGAPAGGLSNVVLDNDPNDPVLEAEEQSSQEE